jgi:hypothetical protein
MKWMNEFIPDLMRDNKLKRANILISFQTLKCPSPFLRIERATKTKTKRAFKSMQTTHPTHHLTIESLMMSMMSLKTYLTESLQDKASNP